VHTYAVVISTNVCMHHYKILQILAIRCFLTYTIIHAGDTGLRGPVGEAGISGANGAKGDQGDTIRLYFGLSFTYFKLLKRPTRHKRREG